MFVELTENFGGNKVFVNLDHILKMMRFDHRTSLYLSNQGEILVKETPEQIAAMVSPIVTTVDCGGTKGDWIPDKIMVDIGQDALDEGRAKWMYGYYRSAMWSRTGKNLCVWDELLPIEKESWTEVAKNFRGK